MAALAATAACSRPAEDNSGDWCTDTIAALTAEQQRWYDYDKSHGGENEDLTRFLTPPNPPATAEQIGAAEQRVGKRFDRQLRQWLGHANGWPFVFGTSALFSTDQLTQDSPARAVFMDLIDEFDVPEEEFGVNSFDDLILIGTNDNQSHFILTVGCTGNGDCDSAPVWTFDGDTRKYPSLRDYLTTMVEQLKTVKRSP
ncbi:SMI1/KNR4 family protein [Nocardia blacklockiae]|uniref:SMI1/KNR4 family protein n=1 Tax=Nocardia blacklockiae TaxID=480036 RepID=UPI0018935F2F|nr:SMI1/KNR4 family protein [Nocardia blacklockiae]MBF6171314.1 SMI1/KNR4 family protein [Nocardia blacklockiae]